jgi:hypothetical protein
VSEDFTDVYATVGSADGETPAMSAQPHDLFVSRLDDHRIQTLLLLLALPLADFVPRHPIKDAVLVAYAEPAGGKPPPDSSPDCGPPTPALGSAAAFVVPRVMDAVEKRGGLPCLEGSAVRGRAVIWLGVPVGVPRASIAPGGGHPGWGSDQ